MNDRIWVKSKTGKPVHIVDTTIQDKKGDYVRICIDNRMVKENIAIEVENTDIIDNAINTKGILKVEPNPEMAKKRYDVFMAQVAKEQSIVTDRQGNVEKLAHDFGLAISQDVLKMLKAKEAETISAQQAKEPEKVQGPVSKKKNTTIKRKPTATRVN